MKQRRGAWVRRLAGTAGGQRSSPASAVGPASSRSQGRCRGQGLRCEALKLSGQVGAGPLGQRCALDFMPSEIRSAWRP